MLRHDDTGKTQIRFTIVETDGKQGRKKTHSSQLTLLVASRKERYTLELDEAKPTIPGMGLI